MSKWGLIAGQLERNKITPNEAALQFCTVEHIKIGDPAFNGTYNMCLIFYTQNCDTIYKKSRKIASDRIETFNEITANSINVNSMNVKVLKTIAKKLDIKGAYKMKKDQLVSNIKYTIDIIRVDQKRINNKKKRKVNRVTK